MADANNKFQQQSSQQPRQRRSRPQEPSDGMVETIIQVSRVSKKTKGGNQIGFSVLTVVGDKNGRVGVGIGKGPDVSSSIRKGFAAARKHLVTVPLVDSTIPHRIIQKLGAAKVLLKPAAPGTGLIAGGSVRAVVDAAGIQNVVAKILGSNNPVNTVYCTVEALKNLKKPEELRIRVKNS